MRCSGWYVSNNQRFRSISGFPHPVLPLADLKDLTVQRANAEKFLQSVQNQVAELGVKIQYCVSQEGADEAR